MLKSLLALLSGVIFGLGLIIAGMANPAKVLAFLDITGQWDPSLALVMVGAIAVAAPAFMWARRRERSLLGNRCRSRPLGVWIAVCWWAARCSASVGALRASAPPGSVLAGRRYNGYGRSCWRCWRVWRCMRLS